MVLTPLLSLRRNDTQRILNGQYMITINLRRRFDASVARQQRAEPYGACLQDDGISAGVVGNRYQTRQRVAP